MRLGMRVLVVAVVPVVAFSWLEPAARVASIPDCGQPQLLDSFAHPPVSCLPTPFEVAAFSLMLLMIAAATLCGVRVLSR
jgi:hypothetical protein